MTKPSGWLVSQLVFWAFTEWTELEDSIDMVHAASAALATTRRMHVIQLRDSQRGAVN